MNIGEYLEKTDDGENITITDMHAGGDYKAVVDALEYGRVSGADIVVDRDDAENLMDTDRMEYLRNSIEAVTATVLEPAYDGGVAKAENVEGDKDQLAKKARRKDSLVKASELGMLGGITASLAGTHIEEPRLIGGGAGAAMLSAGLNARWQGMEDKEMKKASEGLESAYGGRRLKIR